MVVVGIVNWVADELPGLSVLMVMRKSSEGAKRGLAEAGVGWKDREENKRAAKQRSLKRFLVWLRSMADILQTLALCLLIVTYFEVSDDGWTC